MLNNGMKNVNSETSYIVVVLLQATWTIKNIELKAVRIANEIPGRARFRSSSHTPVSQGARTFSLALLLFSLSECVLSLLSFS